MEEKLVHEIELYPFETFTTLLEYEVKRSKRYADHLTLVHLVVETDDSGPDAQYGAENFAINVLNVQLRDVDIPCRIGNEFLVLMPCTDELGGRVVCDRLERLFRLEADVYDKVSFKLTVYIGMINAPGDKIPSSKQLTEGAAKAMNHARQNRLEKTVVFSELEE